jgi:hypothetical protein
MVIIWGKGVEMLTYNDLLSKQTDQERIEFIQQAIRERVNSVDYRTAEKAMAYYNGENPDIAAFEKYVYDLKGIAHRDYISANSKIRNGYYPLIIDEAVSHLLANGIGFEHEQNKEKLGKGFDDTMKKIYREALVCGVSYGFYDGEKTIHIPYLQFCPVLDDYSGRLRAGIYWTQIDDKKPLTVYFYEQDGFTIYVQEYGEEMKIVEEKQRYVVDYRKNEAEGKYYFKDASSSYLPIYPLYNLTGKSNIIGSLEILIAIDLMASQLVNNVSQAELVYWVLKNYGGMDDIADANFIVNLIKSHVIHVEDDGDATPHQITVPFEANDAAYARLKAMLFENLRGVNHEVMDAGNLTATAINSAYSRLRNFSGLIESNVFDFLRGLLAIAGIDEDETFTVEYNETINTTEAINNTIASAPLLGDTATTERLALLNGLGDKIDQIMQEKSAEQITQFNVEDEQVM